MNGVKRNIYIGYDHHNLQILQDPPKSQPKPFSKFAPTEDKEACPTLLYTPICRWKNLTLIAMSDINQQKNTKS